jgi:hypothetical protein
LEDQDMMMQEAGGGTGAVGLDTFLSLMACSMWY